MIVFGGRCLNVRSGVRDIRTNRLTEVTDTAVPAGASTGTADAASRIRLFR